MSKKSIKYGIALVVVVFLAYHSVYFRKLDEVKAATSGSFDAEAYTADFWSAKLLPSLPKAVQLDTLMTTLKNQPEEAFEKYSHALGIGNLKYFMVQGEGEVVSVDENRINVKLKGSNSTTFSIITEYVYGNEVRDASGLIPMNEFDNTMDFNSVSAALNKKIREEVIPPFKKEAKVAKRVKFFGALELNQKYLEIDQMELVPVQLEIIN
jgi:predicted lipoprotein